jgi:sulfhydrogenase subunit beta (sulfur reductase)
MKTLAKKDLIEVLKGWSRDYTVLSPNKISRDESMFDVFDEQRFTLDYTKPSMPPKSSFLPHSNTIFTVDEEGYHPVIAEKKTILFGIRACDMKGILQSMSFMTADTDDVFYRAYRENTLTVVMACAGPQNETCFCTTTNSGPIADKGYDLQFYDMGDTFLIEAGSETGASLITAGEFSDVDEAGARKEIDSFRKEAQQKIPLVPQLMEAMDKLANNGVSDELWELFGKKCIVCGGCTFVCPTCTCFNVIDRKVGNSSGERLRTWDACLYAGFTKEASGHNPRSSQGLRLKRRHEHKLLYYQDRDTHGGVCTCVGCGRCSDYCPVHIGTIEIVKAIVED